MVHCVRYLAFGVLQDKGNILLHEIFKVLKFKTHGGERGQWPSQGGLKEHFLNRVCSLKAAAIAFSLIVIHSTSSATGKLMKMLGLQGFILLLRILSGYSIM